MPCKPVIYKTPGTYSSKDMNHIDGPHQLGDSRMFANALSWWQRKTQGRMGTRVRLLVGEALDVQEALSIHRVWARHVLRRVEKS